jgi:hypothetical protein
MSREAWFWSVLIVVSTAGCIRQFYLLLKALATPDEWTKVTSSLSHTTEGGHASDHESL